MTTPETAQEKHTPESHADTTCRCDECGKLATRSGSCPDIHCQGRATHCNYWLYIFQTTLDSLKGGTQ